MDQSTRENLNWEQKKVMECTNGLTNHSILDTGRIMSLMAREITHGQTAGNTKVFGNRIK